MIFKCRNCGGNTVYDPGRKKMYCPHCESIDSETMVEEGSITCCGNCGAPLDISPYTSADRCAHCGSYLVFNERVEGVYEPHLILPFQVDKDKAVEALNREFYKRTFTPSGFLSEKSLEGMKGVYVPFWLYDYQAHYSFHGQGTKVRSWQSGNMRYVETSYYQIIRQMEAGFEKVPVDASIAMNDGEMDLMEPYQYQELEGFLPKYMSGFYGEVYNQSAPELEGRAQVKARNASEELMKQSLAGYNTIQAADKQLNLDRCGVHYALMPVWMYLYQYRGQTYRFHVNGQTGKVVGKTPVSKGKVLLYGFSVLAYVSAIVQLALSILEIL
ncbi:MAG: TFIIB-type zinc ribbon-containing protein [Muribaculaceae bacterium]|nr:TFIIB-type zinc ribbon-containing protein [Muribaculaceae bacterium]